MVDVEHLVGGAVVVSAYLVGSVCFGLMYARRVSVDLREVGSGNVGATNVGRALGRRAAWVVLVLDLLKGVAPMLAAQALAVPAGFRVAAGLAAVLGHVFPVWFGFRGGKGAATGVGVLLGAVPWAGLLACATFGLLKLLTHRASVGSLGATTIGFASTFALLGPSADLLLAGLVWALVAVCHHENIRRLVRGEEPAT